MHQECTPPADLAILASKMQTLHNDVSDIKGTLKDLTSAINKLALVEERLANTNAAQERAFKAIASMEKRLDEIDKVIATTTHTTIWVDRSIMALVGAAVMFIWEKVTKGHL